MADYEDVGVSVRGMAESSIIEEIKQYQYEDPILAQYKNTTLEKGNCHAPNLIKADQHPLPIRPGSTNLYLCAFYPQDVLYSTCL